MHPLSTALPIAARMPAIVAKRNRLALWGHQAGVIIAAGGWLVRGRILMAVLHIAWLFMANTWFELQPRLRERRRAARR